MPKASKTTAADSMQVEGYEGHYENFDGGYTVAFETFTQDSDPGEFFKGLPDDRCQCPHWGYVLKGKVTYKTVEARRRSRRATRTTCRRDTLPWGTREARSSSSVRRESCSRQWKSSRRTWRRRTASRSVTQSLGAAC
jgi:hypothetical protein